MSFASCQGSDLTVRNLTILGDLIMDTSNNEGTSNNDNIITNLIQNNNYKNSINLNDSNNCSITMQSNQDIRLYTHGGNTYIEDVSGNTCNCYINNGVLQVQGGIYGNNYFINNGYNVKPQQVIINNSNLTNSQFYLTQISNLSYINNWVCDNTNTGDVYIILNHEYDNMQINIFNEMASHNIIIQNETGGQFYGKLSNSTNYQLDYNGNKYTEMVGINGNWFVTVYD